MRISILIISSILLMYFSQCEPRLTVSVNDVQIDTLKLHRISKQKTIKGKLLSWRDTAKAIAAGEVEYVQTNDNEVEKGDTVMLLNMPNRISSPRQKWIDHSAIKSLNKKILLLATTLQRVDKLKTYQSKDHKLEESDFEQLAVSLEHTGIHINDLQESVDFNRIRQGIEQKIKKLKIESANLEEKLKNNQIELGHIPLLSKCSGRITMLVDNNEEVKPGDPLFYIMSDHGENVVIKLDQVPSEEMQFIVNVRMDDEVLKVKLEDIEEEKRIVRIAGDMLHHLEKNNSTIRVSFESKPSERLLVKRSALYKKDGEYFVFVKRDGIFEAVNVKIGHSRGAMIEIVEGLQPNDQIIVSSSKPIWHLSHLEIRN